MKQYLLSVYHPEDSIPEPAVAAKIMADVEALNTELQQTGTWVFAGGLHPSSTATVVRVEGDDILITDGPFAEGKEHIGGFWVIRAPDLDSALNGAARPPGRAPYPSRCARSRKRPRNRPGTDRIRSRGRRRRARLPRGIRPGGGRPDPRLR